jgi:putative ABC transport system permease protein
MALEQKRPSFSILSTVTTTSPRPPRWAAGLLARILPADHRDAILGDLAELYATRVASRGWLLARAWYWLMAVAMAWGFLRERDDVPHHDRGARGALVRGLPADLRYATRMALKNPWMSAAAVISLAGAMAVTIASFSLVWDAYYTELPFANADRIVAMRDIDPQTGRRSPPRLGVAREWRAHGQSFTEVAASYTRPQDVAGGHARYPVSTMTASGFRVAGVEPMLGRVLLDTDEDPGAEPVVVLGHRAWTMLFGADAGAIGRTLEVDGQTRRIVGVMPSGFRFPISEDLWIPFRIAPSRIGAVEPRWLRVFGRLAPRATMAQAEAELEAIRAGYAGQHPEDTELQERRTSVVSYVQSEAEPGEEGLFLALFAFILLILAVASASVANLLLCRSMARRGEIAVRAAMGASRGRLVFQLFIEALLLTSVAAAAGVGAAALGLRWFNAFIPLENLPFWVRFGISPAATVFAVVAAFVAAILASVAPALRATSGSLVAVLNDESRGTSGVRFGAVSAALTIAEVAIAVACLGAAGLAGRSLLDATSTSASLPGRETLVADVQIAGDVTERPDGTVRVPADAIPPERWLALAEEVRLAVAALPGVRTVALATTLPMRQHGDGRIDIAGPTLGEPHVGVRTLDSEVTPEFFDAFGARLLAGRLLTHGDTLASEPVAVVNRSLAERFFGGEAPMGRRLRRAGRDGTEPWLTIVGIVEDLPMNPVGDGQPGYYRAFAQGSGAAFSLAARVGGSPSALARGVKMAVRQIDERIDVARLETHAEMAEGMLVSYKILSLMLIGLGGTALFLAVAGLYAVMSFSVIQRTREIGIRLALGATRAGVTAVILRRGLRQIAIGLAIGSAGGWALINLISYFPLGMSAAGPSLLAMAAGTMLAAGVGACLVPTARTLRVDPVEALRHD